MLYNLPLTRSICFSWRNLQTWELKKTYCPVNTFWPKLINETEVFGLCVTADTPRACCFLVLLTSKISDMSGMFVKELTRACKFEQHCIYFAVAYSAKHLSYFYGVKSFKIVKPSHCLMSHDDKSVLSIICNLLRDKLWERW